MQLMKPLKERWAESKYLKQVGSIDDFLAFIGTNEIVLEGDYWELVNLDFDGLKRLGARPGVYQRYADGEWFANIMIYSAHWDDRYLYVNNVKNFQSFGGRGCNLQEAIVSAMLCLWELIMRRREMSEIFV